MKHSSETAKDFFLCFSYLFTFYLNSFKTVKSNVQKFEGVRQNLSAEMLNLFNIKFLKFSHIFIKKLNVFYT